MRPDTVEQAEVRETTRDALPVSPRAARLFALSTWVGLTGLVVCTILALRLGFMMGDANPRARAVDFINDISGPLVYPFADIMRTRTLDNGGVFEPATAIAMGMYVIATILVLLVLWSLTPRRPAGRQTVVRQRRIVHQP